MRPRIVVCAASRLAIVGGIVRTLSSTLCVARRLSGCVWLEERHRSGEGQVELRCHAMPHGGGVDPSLQGLLGHDVDGCAARGGGALHGEGWHAADAGAQLFGLCVDRSPLWGSPSSI